MLNSIKNKNKNTKGYYTVEAAIFLPVFILALLTIGYLMKVAAVSENVMDGMVDRSRQVSIGSYVNKTSIGLNKSYIERINRNNAMAENLKIDNLRYLYSSGGIEDLIYVKASYDMHINVPLNVYSEFSLDEALLFRGFTGKDNDGAVFPFSEMEKNGDSVTVWVFPTSGTKYHRFSCRYISNYPKQMVLSDSVRGRYKPCSLCGAKNCSNGNLVYCFTNSGQAYHTGNCKSVDKYVISITKAKAEEQGYTPCSACGGT